MLTRLLPVLTASLLALWAGTFSGPGLQPVPVEPFRPNVVWIIADDLSPILAAYGDSTAHTPHLDRLAREGVTYERAYVTTPVCAPSRTALVTGVHPTSMGALHMRTQARTSAIDQVTDPELLAIPTYEAVPPPDVRPVTWWLQRAGYFTANRGKEDYQFATPEGMWDARGDSAHWQLRPGPDQPFFYVYNDRETHESQIWRRTDEPLSVDPAAVPLPPYYPDTPAVRRDVARQYANLERTDANVGRVLAELEAGGVLEETVVVFIGDHGDGLPRAKRELYDSGLRVPLIVRVGARVREALGERLGASPPGGRVASPVSAVDLAPTALSLAGLAVPSSMEGPPFLAAPLAPPRRYAVGTKGRMDPSLDEARAVTDGRWKYILNYHPERPYVQFLPYRDQSALMQELYRLRDVGGLDRVQRLWFRATKPVEELYDTWSDPYEVRDLAADPAHANKLAELRGALGAWADVTGDPGPVAETALVAELWLGGVQPVTEAPVVTTTRSDGEVEVALSSETEGALLAWSVDGGPWQPYREVFRVAHGADLRVRAHRLGYASAEVTVRVPGGPADAP